MAKNDKHSSPISSGWRGNINGHVKGTNGTQVQVGAINVTLDAKMAFCLCNLLHEQALERANAHIGMSLDQIAMLSNLGAVIGRFIDHGAANNGDRDVIR